MKIKRHFLWLLAFVLLYSVWVVPSARAHALLLRSTPAANAVLEVPPVQVEIFFSEPLEQNLSSIKVLDSNGVSVDVGDVRVDPSDPTRMTVSLHSLNPGVFTITWKAVSSVDGHQTVGSFPFAVGSANANAVSAIQQSTSFRLPFSTLISKFLMLACLAILLGHRFFIALVWDPTVNPTSDAIAKPASWATFYRIGLMGILVAVGLGILAQTGQSSGGELGFPWNLEMGRILTETRLGVIWLTRLALTMLSVWLATRGQSRWTDWGGFTANLGLLFTITLTSHAATEAKPFLPVVADWLHLIGMTFWLGGLVYFFTGIHHVQHFESRTRTKLTATLASRFSIHALLFVGLIGLTGFYSASLRVGSWPALLTSLYGHVLLVKQAFVAGLLLIAATNLFIISPRLRRDQIQATETSGLVARFGKILIAELTFAALLLGSVSFLTYIPPARIVSVTPEIKRTQRVDDLKMDISISPGQVGQNTFKLMVMANGQPLHSAKKVLLRFTSNQPNIPPSELELIGQGDGTFTAKGTYLSIPGSWQVQAIVRRADKFDAYANFDIALQKPGASQEAITLPRQTGFLLLIVGLLCGLLTFTITLKPAPRLGAGLPLSILLLTAGVVLITRPIQVNNEQANPIPPNSESVAAGQAIFTSTCAPCHGPSGKGDGPVGVALNPRPADLTQHAIPGVHTDAQLYEWISNGFPGSRMPAFRSTLSDTDRWNLVNFIRTLAPK